MVRIGPGQSGSGSTDDDSGDTDTTSRQTGRRGAVEQDDPEDVADSGDDGGGTGGDTGGRQTGRSGAVEQDDPADVADGGGDSDGATTDPANTPRERAVDQTPEPTDEPTRGTDISPSADRSGPMDSDQTEGTTPIVSGVGSGSIESRQQLNRLTGPGVAAWEIEDRASALEQRVADRTAADTGDIRIDLRPGVGLVPVFSEDFRQEQREGREIDFSQAVDRQVGEATRNIAGERGAAQRERRQELEQARDIEISQLTDRQLAEANRQIAGERRAEQRPEDDDGIVEAFTGPPGAFERDIGYAVSDPVGAVTGSPGTLEAEAGYAVSDPVGAITGAPGSIEAGAGDVAYGVRDVSAGAAGTIGPAAGDILAAPVRAPEGLAAGLFGAEAVEGANIQTTESTGDFLESTGEGLTEATVGAPAGAVDLGSLAASGGEFTARQIEEEGLVEGGGTSLAAGGAFGATVAATVAEQATTDPVGFGGTITGSVIGGVGAARTFERITTAARVRAQTRGDTVDFEDITSERGAEGELPEFETDPSAPTEEAVEEVTQRARDQPDVLESDLGETILFRSETERLPGDLEASIGQYELPGLFASPDASPLRLDIGADTSLSSLRPRAPRPFASPQRLSAFESPDIEGMPASATGARRIEAPEGGTMPDPETGGAQFLTREAEPGTAYVRPTGSRTAELEAIYPPGSQFVRESARGVDVPGGTPATLDIYRRVDVGDTDVDIPEEAVLSLDEVVRRESRSRTPDGQPVSPFAPTTTTPVSGTVTTTGIATRPISTPATTVGMGDSRITDVSEPTATESVSVSTSETAVTEPVPTESAPPTSMTGTPTTGTTPPTTPPTSPPSRPPSSPPGTPSQPPTSPPSTPPGPPTRPPRFDGDEQEEDETIPSYDESDFLEEYEYGVADPFEVLGGEEL